MRIVPAPLLALMGWVFSALQASLAVQILFDAVAARHATD
jgi:hypothetical protein